jgi:hypothetical protein
VGLEVQFLKVYIMMLTIIYRAFDNVLPCLGICAYDDQRLRIESSNLNYAIKNGNFSIASASPGILSGKLQLPKNSSIERQVQPNAVVPKAPNTRILFSRLGAAIKLRTKHSNHCNICFDPEEGGMGLHNLETMLELRNSPLFSITPKIALGAFDRTVTMSHRSNQDIHFLSNALF